MTLESQLASVSFPLLYFADSLVGNLFGKGKSMHCPRQDALLSRRSLLSSLTRGIIETEFVFGTVLHKKRSLQVFTFLHLPVIDIIIQFCSHEIRIKKYIMFSALIWIILDKMPSNNGCWKLIQKDLVNFYGKPFSSSEGSNLVEKIIVSKSQRGQGAYVVLMTTGETLKHHLHYISREREVKKVRW